MVTWVLNVPSDHRPDPRACVAKQNNKDRNFNVLGDGEECHEIKRPKGLPTRRNARQRRRLWPRWWQGRWR